MIAVIADDLTGAAELAGIGLRHGLQTEIRTAVGAPTDADLLVIAADSRSKPKTAAIEEMTTITKALKGLQPDLIYKKTDSVLRGHVLPELQVHLHLLGLRLALLVPANPALGRTIHDGHYYLNGAPIHHSSFAVDPEFPIHDSNVQSMLHTTNHPIPIRKPAEALPSAGIVLGEAQSAADLHTWAARIPPDTLPAGAASFFSAILDARTSAAKTEGPPLGAPRLYICGTTFEPNRKGIRQKAAEGGPVTYLSQDLGRVSHHLHTHGKAIIAIDANPDNLSALQLREKMARSIAPILQTARPAELIIEGGSTAYAILQEMGWHTFIPVEEFAQGVVRMRVPDIPGLHITVKPGSYAWPPAIRY